MVDSFREVLSRLGLALPDFVLLIARMRASELWNGVLLDVEIPIGAVNVTVPHGLSREHRGGFVVVAEYAVPAFVREAQDEKNVTVFIDSAQTVTLSYRLWVF